MFIVIYFILLSRVIRDGNSHVDDRNRHNWWQRWDNQGRNIKMSDYDNWKLDALREECNKREIIINSKDGIKTLAARLRTYDRNNVEKTDKAQALEVHNTQPGEFEDDESMQNLSDSLGNLKLASDLKMKNVGEIPGDFEKVNYPQWENTPGALSFRERMELLRFERDLEREREAREVRREERRQQTRFEERAFEVELERERAKTSAAFENSGKFVNVREMREAEDIDDYFRIFEMTAKTQRIPRSEWLGSLAPRLSEKAKSIFLEISGLDACDYDKSKEIILKSYQLNVDHYRSQFRHAEKKLDEDFGQWAHRTRRYLDRWMSVAKATGDPEKILDQLVIEHLLNSVRAELCVWLKERKPATAEELAMLANEYVQIRGGPVIGGNLGQRGKFDKSKVKCFSCQEKGHYSYECKNRNPAQEGQACVLTRRQVALKNAQTRLDQCIDDQNQMTVEKSQWDEIKDNNKSVDNYNLNELFEFEPNNSEHKDKPNKEGKTPTESIEEKRNILNRNRARLIQDRIEDVTLGNAKVSDTVPLQTEGFFWVNNVLMHRKFTKYAHDGLFYVDRIVVPEVYRQEILRFSHSLPLSGQEKTYERIAMHFFLPWLYSEVWNYCATCPQWHCVEGNLLNSRAQFGALGPSLPRGIFRLAAPLRPVWGVFLVQVHC